jgi:hypothetical protein
MFQDTAPNGRRLDWDTSPYDEHTSGMVVAGLARNALLYAAEDAVTRHGVVPDATAYDQQVTEFQAYLSSLGRGIASGNY